MTYGLYHIGNKNATVVHLCDQIMMIVFSNAHRAKLGYRQRTFLGQDGRYSMGYWYFENADIKDVFLSFEDDS